MSNENKKKERSIIINGTEYSVTEKELSFEDILNLAYDNSPPTGEYIVFDMTYRRAHGNKPEGTLHPGEVLKVKEGMIINVTATDKS